MKKMQDVRFSAQFLRNLRYCNNLLIYLLIYIIVVFVCIFCSLARALAWRPGVFFIKDFQNNAKGVFYFF